MADIVNPATGKPLTSALPENPISGSSYVDNAVTGTAFGPNIAGVYGSNQPKPAPAGTTAIGPLVPAAQIIGDGVHGTGLNGVHGVSAYLNGVLGENTEKGCGVAGTSQAGHGVRGTNGAGSGFTPKYGCGAWGDSANGYGVYGASTTASAVYGISTKGLAGEFDGKVTVTGTLTVSGAVTMHDASMSGALTISGAVTANDVILMGADCAEEFDIIGSAAIEPGTVVVLDENGALSPCRTAYERRVAGVVSGAGDYQPGVVLDRRMTGAQRAAIALVGKVFCKVDAEFEAICVGDLLTTSPTPGFAMKASDRDKAFGAVIGKALSPMAGGRGLLPILVALQ